MQIGDRHEQRQQWECGHEQHSVQVPVFGVEAGLLLVNWMQGKDTGVW